MKVKIRDIHRASMWREALNPDRVEYYRALWEADKPPAPIVLFIMGGAYWVGDGYHRIEAAQLLGFAEVEARIEEGGSQEALWYAAGANQVAEERRQAVEHLLRDPKLGQLSNKVIGNQCHVASTTVLRARLRLVKSGEIQKSTVRTYTRKGGTHQMRLKQKKQKVKDEVKKLEYHHSFGVFTADQAVRLLQTIHKKDTKRKEGLELVCEWIRTQGACKHEGGCNGKESK